MGKWPITECTEWGRWLSPRTFSHLPVHRWYTFPHSFSPEFVPALAREWNLGASDLLLDPFLGSGTTALSAQHFGIPCHGYDLSPLACFVSQAKSERPSSREVERSCDAILDEGPLPDKCEGHGCVAEPFLERAFGEERLTKLLALTERIRQGGYGTTVPVLFDVGASRHRAPVCFGRAQRRVVTLACACESGFADRGGVCAEGARDG